MAKRFSYSLAWAIAMSVVNVAYAAPATNRTPATIDFASCDKPTWPRKSLEKEEVGTVHLAFLISAEGIVKDAQVTQSSGAPLLDEAALEGVRKCKFFPATEEGKPYETWQKMQYVWTLDIVTAEEEEAARLLQEKDFPGAVRLLRVAAERNRPQAQLQLASMLYHGDGVSIDKAQAIAWLKRAAEQFHVPAMSAYGAVLVERGGADDEAIYWLREAAKKGDGSAMYVLGICHELGRGTAVDKEQARVWYGRAEQLGELRASAALKRL